MFQIQRFLRGVTFVFAGLAACGETPSQDVSEDVPSDIDTDTNNAGDVRDVRPDADDAGDETDTEPPCILDFPCFDELKGCSNDRTELYTFQNYTDPMCSGIACHTVRRQVCEAGTACVLEWVDGKPDGNCRPVDELCGGPTRKTCGENEFCDIRGTYAYSPQYPCQRLKDGHFGICRPETECAGETAPEGTEVCGCHADADGDIVYKNYPNDCARRAAGDNSLCPKP